MTKKELKKVMKKMVDRPNSLYADKPPYNCCYYDGTFLYADCVCVIKGICWSDGACADNYTTGRYYYSPDSVMGDWTGKEILDHCKDVSTDMSHIEDCEFLYWENENGDWHCGIYYGEENGQRLVFEATPAWENGIQFSTIGKDGTRPFDGESTKKWTYHGKLWWVDYSDEEEVKEDTTVSTPVQTTPVGQNPVGQTIIVQNTPNKELTETVEKPTIVDSVINLLKIKSLVTLALTAVVAVRAINGDMDIEQIYLMVIAFYFGTQTIKDK